MLGFYSVSLVMFVVYSVGILVLFWYSSSDCCSLRGA